MGSSEFESKKLDPEQLESVSGGILKRKTRVVMTEKSVTAGRRE